MKLENISAQATIKTDRFVLRPLRRSDMGLIELYAGDLRVARMTGSIPHPLPPGATEAYLDRVLAPGAEETVWAIDASGVGERELLGQISLTRVMDYQCEVGYWIAPQFWNSGLASVAVQALVNANPLDSRSMVASIFQDNPASAKVVTNAGFALVGESESYSVARRATVDTWDYVQRLQA